MAYCGNCKSECLAEPCACTAGMTQSNCCWADVYHDQELRQPVKPDDLPQTQTWLDDGARAQGA